MARPFIIVSVHLFVLPAGDQSAQDSMRGVTLAELHITRLWDDPESSGQRTPSVRLINNEIYIRVRKQAAHRSGSH